MNFAAQYLALIGWVAGPVVAGTILRRLGVPRSASRLLFGMALYFFQTTITFLAVWAARLDGRAMLLPAVALAGWFFAAAVTWFAGRLMRHEPQQHGAFVMTGCMSNHGYTLLGIVALMLFGEAGLAQATYAQFFFIPFMVLFCFPVARRLGGEPSESGALEIIRKTALDPRNLPLAAMIAGVALGASGAPRPEAAAAILGFLVYSGTVVSGVAVGLQLRRSARKYVRENAFSFVFRSTLYPGFFLVAAIALGMDPLDTRILVLYGLVPSALFSNLVADMFGLDTDLTNSVFVVGTALFLAFVLPVYSLIAA